MRESRFKYEDIRQALELSCGNITHAAVILEISKMHAFRLIEKYDLSDYAKSLRTASGCAATGRPRTSLGPVTNGNISVDSLT